MTLRRWLLLAALALIVFGGGTILSYYVDSLWFDSLGYGDVFWKTLRIQSLVFTTFGAVTFLILYGSFLALKPERLDHLIAAFVCLGATALAVAFSVYLGLPFVR